MSVLGNVPMLAEDRGAYPDYCCLSGTESVAVEPVPKPEGIPGLPPKDEGAREGLSPQDDRHSDGFTAQDDRNSDWLTAKDCYSGDGYTPPTLTADIDVLWLQPAYQGTQLGRTFVVASGATIDTLSSKDNDTAIEPGARLRLVIQSCTGDALEAVYFGLQYWSGGRTLSADPAAGILAGSPWTQTDKLVGGFDESLGFQLTSRLNNVEINFLRAAPDVDRWSLDLLGGVRYVKWDEVLGLEGVNTLPAAVEQIDVSCHNQLIGPQIGGQLQRSGEHFQVTLEGKIGLMLNCFQSRRSNLDSTGVQPGGSPAITPVNNATDSACVAGVIDLSASGAYRLTSHVAARAGYQLLFLDGLAQAPRQLADFNHSGSVLLYGPSAGMEVTW
jgi:hypothetical protein